MGGEEVGHGRPEGSAAAGGGGHAARETLTNLRDWTRKRVFASLKAHTSKLCTQGTYYAISI